MNHFELQNFLFEKELKRLDLYTYQASCVASYKVRIYRNHSFELVEHTIAPYLDYGAIGVEFLYSDYDDSLTFFDLDTSTDLLILWLDMGRYHNVPVDFFEQRIHKLRSVYFNPILFVGVGGQLNILSHGNFQVVDSTEIEKSLQEAFLDEAKEKLTGTRLSPAACLQFSRLMGLRYIPAVLRPPLKAIVVDLDNTLYSGVLGEDGAEGVLLTPGHVAFQTRLKQLGKQGFFLCVASKNDIRDVETLLERRSDFPLRKGDFTKINASWNSKADAISEIASFLNIHPDSMLFIDDNMGELYSVLSVHPHIQTIYAYEDGARTERVLSYYPGMLKLTSSAEDNLRNADVKANEMRANLREAITEEEYLRSLEIQLEFAIDDPAQALRVSELSNKTNQFIFHYMRYSLEQVETLMSSSQSAVVTVSLRDKLSDSGIIGVCTAMLREETVVIEELFVSCRALGRGLDEVIVLGLIQVICEKLKRYNVCVEFVKGERNIPAEKFAQKHLGSFLSNSAEFHYHIPEEVAQITIR